MNSFPLGTLTLGGLENLFIIAGPCVIESETHTLRIAGALTRIFSELGKGFIFKASYDKANRSSGRSFRGPGMTEGLRILAEVKRQFRIPVLTDIHECQQAGPAAEVADILQIPAFLSRQTDLVAEAARTGRIVNVKKGQFLSPWDMANVVEKIRSAGGERIILTERGCSFGYNNLVVDFRSLAIMRRLGCPVVFDATHAVQLPGGQGHESGGDAAFIEPLARAAVACGVDGLFFEVHDNPCQALCDGPNSLVLDRFQPFLETLFRIRAAAHPGEPR